MAAAGQNYVQNVKVSHKPDDVMQYFVSATAGASGYTITTAGPNTLVLTRKYIPTWAVVVAIVGLAFFLVGLLALLFKETETLTINLSEVEGGTKVSIAGVADAEMVARLNAGLSNLQPLQRRPETAPPEVAGVAAEAAHLPESVERPVETKVCPECAETVKLAALVCRYCGHKFSEISTSPGSDDAGRSPA